MGVHDDTAIEREPRTLGERDPWAHADTDDDEVRLQQAPVVEPHLLGAYGCRRLTEMELDSMLLMQRANEVSHLRAEDTLHRPPVGRDHVDFDLAMAQGGRDLETDEARPEHDHAACRLSALDDGAAVGERA